MADFPTPKIQIENLPPITVSAPNVVVNLPAQPKIDVVVNAPATPAINVAAPTIQRVSWVLPACIFALLQFIGMLGYAYLSKPEQVLLTPTTQCFLQENSGVELRTLELPHRIVFASGSHDTLIDGFDDLQALLDDFSARRDVVLWRISTGHDVDELTPAARRKYPDNDTLAQRRAEWLGQHIERTGQVVHLKARPALRTKNPTKEDKSADRTAQVTAVFIAPTTNQKLRLIPCPSKSTLPSEHTP